MPFPSATRRARPAPDPRAMWGARSPYRAPGTRFVTRIIWGSPGPASQPASTARERGRWTRESSHSRGHGHGHGIASFSPRCGQTCRRHPGGCPRRWHHTMVNTSETPRPNLPHALPLRGACHTCGGVAGIDSHASHARRVIGSCRGAAGFIVASMLSLNSWPVQRICTPGRALCLLRGMLLAGRALASTTLHYTRPAECLAVFRTFCICIYPARDKNATHQNFGLLRRRHSI